MLSALFEENFSEIGAGFSVLLDNPQVPCVGGLDFKKVSMDCHKSMYNRHKLILHLFHNLLGQYLRENVMCIGTDLSSLLPL